MVISMPGPSPCNGFQRPKPRTLARRGVLAWARRHGPELLFIDDNILLLEATARAFRRVGAPCRTAGSYEDAIRVLEEDASLNIVIVDYEMPDGDVGELVPRLRAVRSGVLLIGTSGGDREQDFAKRGIERFVAKPWSFDELAAAMAG